MLTMIVFILRLIIFAISTAAQSGQQVAAGTQKRLGGPGGSAGMLKGRAGAAQGKAIGAGQGAGAKLKGAMVTGGKPGKPTGKTGRGGKPGTGGKRKPRGPMGAAAIYRAKDRKAAARSKQVAGAVCGFTSRAGRF